MYKVQDFSCVLGLHYYGTTEEKEDQGYWSDIGYL